MILSVCIFSVVLFGVAVTRSVDNAGELVITLNEFKDAVTFSGYPEPTEKKYEGFTSHLKLGGILTKEEAAMALAQFIWESGGLLAKRELVCIKTGCPGSYETPGCDVKGQRYFGRGYIQLTWCPNYHEASLDLYGNDELIYDPEWVARDDHVAWETAFWYWWKYVHFKRGVAEGLFGVTTLAINGDQECGAFGSYNARKRFEIYKTVRRAFGLFDEADERGCYPVIPTNTSEINNQY